jgi:hypothetical protein
MPNTSDVAWLIGLRTGGTVNRSDLDTLFVGCHWLGQCRVQDRLSILAGDLQACRKRADRSFVNGERVRSSALAEPVAPNENRERPKLFVNATGPQSLQRPTRHLVSTTDCFHSRPCRYSDVMNRIRLDTNSKRSETSSDHGAKAIIATERTTSDNTIAASFRRLTCGASRTSAQTRSFSAMSIF